MSQLLNSYPVFEGNQVLTNTQLNQLVAYLDEQNRLTRAKLIGTGIVCGLDVTYNDTVSPVTLTISKGMGVTSQGFLITLGDCVVNQYIDYTLPAGVSYPPFEDPQTTVQDVALYELLTEDAEILPGQTPHPLDDPSVFLDDKIVLLFLECSDIDLKSCLGQSCDERGIDRIFNVRKLLISKADMNTVLSRTCTQSGLYPDQYTLPEVIIRRALFDPESDESSNYFRFSEVYVDAVRGDEFVSPFNTDKTDLYQKLFDALRQTYTDFAAFLGPVYSGTNPFDNLPEADWNSFLNGSSTGPNYLGVQYFYDFIKDLILAYNEFRDCAFDLVTECCINMDCFPKHLMLGEAIPTAETQPSEYRHGLVLSPAFDQQKDLLQKVIMLHKRMVIMTQQFNLSIINNPSTTPVPPSQLGVPVLITPSNEKRDPLSLRSIPYYYNIDVDSGGLGTLEENWNYTYIEKFLFSKDLQPLAYGNQDIVQTNDQGPVATPLYYDTDQYNFLRIEGAIRQNYVDVTAELEDLRDQFDLPFNIVTLRLTGEPLDDISERCDFDDIRTEYGTLRTGIECMTQKLFDRYAQSVRGTIRLKPFPTFLTALINQANSDPNFGSVTQPQTGETVLIEAPIGRTPASDEIADSSDDGDSSRTPGEELEATRVFPIYAPQRTMSEAVSDIQDNLLQMATKLNTLNTQFLPFNITDFDYGYTGTVQNEDDGFIQTYLDALQFAINAKVDFNQIFDLIIRSLKLKNTPELYFDLMLYAREVMGQLDDFITDCRYQSLTLLYYTYQYRLQYLKDNDQNLFSNFIKKHPGIEHMAGVPRGGTYIMVVNGDAVTVDKPSRNFAVAQVREIKNLEVQRARIKAKDFRTIQDDLMLKRIDSELLQIDTIQAELAVGVPVEKIMLEGYQVIADFTLPYACCCDCECQDIPSATTETDLGIPTLATPFYAEYSTGDYAFGHPVSIGMDGDLPTSKIIEIEPTLQYDRNRYSASQIKLFLINKNGTKMLPPREFIAERGAEFNDYSFLSTTNSLNDPDNDTQYGTVFIREYTDGRAPVFIYSPAAGINNVVDSWCFMFEIQDAGGNTVARSTTGSVVMSVT